VLVSQTMVLDRFGVQSPQENRKTVFCRVRSVTVNEFFQSGQQGYRPEYRIAFLAAEYDGEQLIYYRDKPYSVIRVYNLSEDYVEVTVEARAGNGA